MAINLCHRADYHKLCGTRPTSAASLRITEVARMVTLPGSITLTLKATAETLADGTVGARSGVDWEFSELPFPSAAVEDGAFYDAFAGAVEQAMEDALEEARSHPMAG